jgi:D-glycero-alpha-D-manno-heptose-7-phosphate kinase
MAGVKQDQYAATFGGFNFMEFYENDRVIVNPLRIKQELVLEFNYHLLLFFTETKRESSKIIDVQQQNFNKNVLKVMEASHQLKRQSVKMKELLLKGQLSGIGELLHESWKQKKMLASGISNSKIDNIYNVAIKSGALGGKISGAGGGGFMIFYCPGNTRYEVIERLKEINVTNQMYNFQEKGLETWTSTH